jgi:hypothetical protein
VGQAEGEASTEDKADGLAIEGAGDATDVSGVVLA